MPPAEPVAVELRQTLPISVIPSDSDCIALACNTSEKIGSILIEALTGSGLGGRVAFNQQMKWVDRFSSSIDHVSFWFRLEQNFGSIRNGKLDPDAFALDSQAAKKTLRAISEELVENYSSLELIDEPDILPITVLGPLKSLHEFASDLRSAVTQGPRFQREVNGGWNVTFLFNGREWSPEMGTSRGGLGVLLGPINAKLTALATPSWRQRYHEESPETDALSEGFLNHKIEVNCRNATITIETSGTVLDVMERRVAQQGKQLASAVASGTNLSKDQ